MQLYFTYIRTNVPNFFISLNRNWNIILWICFFTSTNSWWFSVVKWL